MRLTMTAVLMVAALVVATPAFAELQNVEVGGTIRIRGNFYSAESDLTNFADDAGNNSNSHFEQRTNITVSADFTNDVSAHVNLQDYTIWGDTSTDVFAYESYIEIRETLGQPLTLRVGRQEIIFGSEWLVGNGDTASGFTGISHDAIVGVYSVEDTGWIAAFASKVVDDQTVEDGDADLYAVYASYTAMEEFDVDVYYILFRDATTATAVDELTTIGGRVTADYMGFDIEAEVATQSGDIESVPGFDFGGLGVNIEVGYSFDMDYQPRVFVGSDVAFQRLLSDWEYSEFLDSGDLGNVSIIRVGASAQVTETVDVSIAYSLFTADQQEDSTGTATADDAIGSEIGLYLNYAYSEDVTLSVGWAHFLSDDGSGAGNAVLDSGTTDLSNASGADEDADYFFWETSIAF